MCSSFRRPQQCERATPKLTFLENGSEVLAHQGYIDAKQFERALAAFKADTKAFPWRQKRRGRAVTGCWVDQATPYEG
jgi:hypothetical protein